MSIRASVQSHTRTVVYAFIALFGLLVIVAGQQSNLPPQTGRTLLIIGGGIATVTLVGMALTKRIERVAVFTSVALLTIIVFLLYA